MPKYLLRIVSDFAKPGWLANVNPLSVAIFVVPVTYLVRKIRPVSSIGIALLIIPFSALSVALTPTLISAGILGDSVNLIFFSLHPVVVMLVIGISIQGVAECFLSPRYYEFASKQAPKGEEGLYMGYQFLNVAVAWLAAFIVSGHLLELWCPAPEVVAAMPPELAAHAYDHAHYIWYVYAMIGVAAFVALLICLRSRPLHLVCLRDDRCCGIRSPAHLSLRHRPHRPKGGSVTGATLRNQSSLL
jgi:MFS family permease